MIGPVALLAVAAVVATSAAVTRWVVVSIDEAWFLQVVRRVVAGDALYGDVFFGAGPLPVWTAAAVVAATRPQLVVARALSIGYAGATAWAAAWVLSAAGAPEPVVALAAIGVLALGGHHLAVDSQYGAMTTLGTLVIAGGCIEGWWPAVALGSVLACSGKYPIGALATTWGLTVLAVEAGVPAALFALGGLGVGVAATAVVLGRGGCRLFYATAVVNKSGYLATARIRPHLHLIGRLRAPRRSVLDRTAWQITTATVYAVAALAAVGAVVGVARFDGNAEDVVGAALCLTGLTVAYPRSDLDHVVAAMPACGTGLFVVFAVGWSEWEAAVAVAILGVVLAAGLVGAVTASKRGEVRRDVPSFRMVPVRRQGGSWPDATGDVIDVAGRSVFLLRRDASFFYLAGGLTDPTRYDYPLASTFGGDGQGATAESIRSGELAWVCWPGRIDDPLAPRQLEDVLERMVPAARTGLGDLYRGGGPHGQ